MLDETRRSITAQISDTFKQKLDSLRAQSQMRIETLEATNRHLSEELASSAVSYAAHL
jgi:hypothetical protein